jgi:hypothetical protein
MTRVGIVREVVVHCGGRRDFIYYSDPAPVVGGPSDATLKVNRNTDGMTDEGRRAAVAELNTRPDIMRAYTTPGGELKVRFKGLARAL